MKCPNCSAKMKFLQAVELLTKGAICSKHRLYECPSCGTQEYGGKLRLHEISGYPSFTTYLVNKPTRKRCTDCTWYQLLGWNDCKTKIPSCEKTDGYPKKISTR